MPDIREIYRLRDNIENAKAQLSELEEQTREAEAELEEAEAELEELVSSADIARMLGEGAAISCDGLEGCTLCDTCCLRDLAGTFTTYHTYVVPPGSIETQSCGAYIENPEIARTDKARAQNIYNNIEELKGLGFRITETFISHIRRCAYGGR